ncbi:hypothetical protein BC830DRAFT_1168573 [Chytriomyces sp. MP71]|nr:hypothetical protein BC830DRAFT_1168573 [Chytriomyces sp. MP71]
MSFNVGDLQQKLGGMVGGLLGKNQQGQQPYQQQGGYSQQYPQQYPQQGYAGYPQQGGYPQQHYQPATVPQPNGPNLPAGWTAQWSAQFQRNYFIEIATGKSQWEPPAFAPPPLPPPGFAPPPGPPSSESTDSKPAPGVALTPAIAPASLATHYNLNAMPSAPVVLTPQQQNMEGPAFIPANAEHQSHSGLPLQPLVATADPTVAIALELKQHVPTLMAAPPAGAKQEVTDAWRTYLRRVQDAQTEHTRTIRDAQVEHDKAIKNAHYNQQQHNMNVGSNLLYSITSLSGIGNQVSNQMQYQSQLKQDLDNAEIQYNRTVERSHQRLNDQVEYANREYEDAIRRYAF